MAAVSIGSGCRVSMCKVAQFQTRMGGIWLNPHFGIYPMTVSGSSFVSGNFQGLTKDQA